VNGRIYSGQTLCAGERRLLKEKRYYCNTAADALMYARQNALTPQKVEFVNEKYICKRN